MTTPMTPGLHPCSSFSIASAGPITGANSRSVTTTAASLWFICQAIIGASRRVFSVLITAFSAGTA